MAEGMGLGRTAWPSGRLQHTHAGLGCPQSVFQADDSGTGVHSTQFQPVALTLECGVHEQSLSNPGPSPRPSRGLEGTQNSRCGTQDLWCNSCNAVLDGRSSAWQEGGQGLAPGLSTSCLGRTWARHVISSLLTPRAQRVLLLLWQLCSICYHFSLFLPKQKKLVRNFIQAKLVPMPSPPFVFSKEGEISRPGHSSVFLTHMSIFSPSSFSLNLEKAVEHNVVGNWHKHMSITAPHSPLGHDINVFLLH